MLKKHMEDDFGSGKRVRMKFFSGATGMIEDAKEFALAILVDGGDLLAMAPWEAAAVACTSKLTGNASKLGRDRRKISKTLARTEKVLCLQMKAWKNFA